MRTQIKRLTIALILLTGPLVFFALPGFASADDRDRERSVIRRGVFEGIWHTDPVQIIITNVNPDGSFTGEIHFDPRGRFGDVRVGFTARLQADNSITMTRDDCPQTARTSRPEWRGRALVWKGQVTAPNIDASFELRIPEWRRR